MNIIEKYIQWVANAKSYEFIAIFNDSNIYLKDPHR